MLKNQKEYIEKYGETISLKLHNTLCKNAVNLNENITHSFISKLETELSEWLTKNGILFKRDRKILKGQELDIYIPDKKIAIEFNGNKYHTEWFGGKNRTYHLSKTQRCKSQGIGLIHIFEDEYFYRQNIVLNKLSHILGLNQNLPKIMGRKCTIQEIDKPIAELFLTTYHIQGYDPSTIHYGAYYNDELVAVMSFMKTRKNENDWELTRFASNFHYVCQDDGGKLFKHYVREHNPNTIK